MGISATIEDAFNEQLRNELQASYIYLSMSAWFEEQDYPGMAAWMQGQSQEERDHAMRFYDHVHQRDGIVHLGSLDAPQESWDDPLDVFESALAHEEKVTGQVHDLVQTARKEGDLAAERFLDWFVDEQVEEEDTLRNIIAQVRMAREDPGALFQLDRELGSRGGGGGEA